MATAIKTNDPFYTPSQAWDFNADLIDLSLVDVTVPQNGILRTLNTDGTTVDNPLPYFSDMLISGLNLSVEAPPNALTIDYTSGTYQINAVVYTIGSSGTLMITAGNSVDPRRDIVYVTTSSTIVYLAGTASPNPIAPTLPANSLKLADIFVDANATTASTGAWLTLVSTNNVQSGTNPDETLRWDDIAGNWVPNSILQSDGLTVGIGTTPSTELLSISGRIELSDSGAPGITIDKLYNDGGDLYWNAIQLNTGTTIAAGTVTNSVLKWNGSSWVEDITTLISSTSIDINTKFFELDNVSAPSSPASGVRIYVNANNLYAQTPTHLVALTANGGLPSGSSGQTLFWNGTSWTASSSILNSTSFIHLTKTVSTNVGLLSLDALTTIITHTDTGISGQLAIDESVLDVNFSNATNSAEFKVDNVGDYRFAFDTPTLDFTQFLTNSIGLWHWDIDLASVNFNWDIDMTSSQSTITMTDGTITMLNDMNFTASTKVWQMLVTDGMVNSNIFLDSAGRMGFNSDTLGFFGVTPVVQASAFTATDPYSPNTGDAGTDTLISNLRTIIDELKAVIENYGLSA